jgi:hypothetical protein
METSAPREGGAGDATVDTSLDTTLPVEDSAADAPQDAAAPVDGPADGPIDSASPCATYVQAVMCDHPIAYYRLNEAQGAMVAHDISGNALNGAYSMVSLGQMGPIPDGGAALFNGSTSVVTVDAGALLFLGTRSFSVEAWINPMILDGRYRGILSGANASNSTGQRDGYSLDVVVMDGGPVTNFERWGSAMSDPVTAASVISDNLWFHYVGTFDFTASPSLVLYLNGSQIGAYSNAPVTIPDAGEMFVIGALFADNPSYPSTFDGLISEVALYDQALDAGSVLKHFTASGRGP